jgi:hypothetical protein
MNREPDTRVRLLLFATSLLIAGAVGAALVVFAAVFWI